MMGKKIVWTTEKREFEQKPSPSKQRILDKEARKRR